MESKKNSLHDPTKNLHYRKQILEVLRATKRGHIGPALSIVDIVSTLYDHVLQYDANNPTWSERDRFILSKGHGCLALYVVLAAKGFFAEDELWRVSDENAMLGGHPEYGLTPGIEASTGSLGHGLSIGVGMALAARMDKKKYRTYVLLGDGECNEGAIWEAALSAAQHKLSNLIVLVDSNKMQCNTFTAEILNMEPLSAKWQSFGFVVKEVDGHSKTELLDAIGSIPEANDKPTVVICHTIKGKGVPEAENNPAWHHKSRLKDEDIEQLLASMEV